MNLVKTTGRLPSQESAFMSDEEDECVSCDICTLPDAQDPQNKMLCCELCNVKVHQGCYSVEETSTKNSKWFCFPCKAGFSPKNLTCALCNHTGGAYKKVAGDESSWVHALCLNWIPDIFEVEDENNKMLGPRADLSTLDKSRFKLQCMVCNQKGGACIQCAYRSCKAAVHPMCLVNDSYEFMGRVIEGVNKTTNYPYFLREAFCPRHTDFVGQPLKKKEMIIQLPSYAKFDVGDNYEPILKEEYAGETFSFPTTTARQAAEKARAEKKQRAGSLSSLDKSAAGKVDQKRKRASTGGDAEACRESTNFPRGVPSKRPKVTIAKAAATTGRMQISPPRTHSGVKRGPASVTATSSSSAAKATNSRAPPYLSINDIVNHDLKSAQSKDTALTAHSSRKSAGGAGAQPSYHEVPSSPVVGTPKRSFRTSAPEHVYVPPSPSLDSIASPEQQPRSGRTPRSAPTADQADHSAPEGRVAALSGASSGRSTRFSPTSKGKEDLLPGLPAVKRNTGRWAKKDDRGPDANASASVLVSTTVTGSGPGPAAGALSATVDATVVQHLQALLQQVLMGMLPTGADSQSSLGSGYGGIAAANASPPQYRLRSSSLPESTWAQLSKAGWLCISAGAASSDSRGAGDNRVHREEIYVTPGTLLSSDDVLNFADLGLKENVQYFGSLGAFRIHLAQNPCLLHPWARTWQALQQQRPHGWRAHYPAATAAVGGTSSSSGGSSEVHTVSRTSSTADASAQQRFAGGNSADNGTLPAPQWIYLSACADGDAVQQGSESAGGSYQEESDEECDHVYGAASAKRRGGSAGGSGAAAPVFVHNCIDGVHRFRTWRELQVYIHRFPYLLQGDATFTNTLLINGWRHRLRVKPEQHSSSSHPQPQPTQENNISNVNDGIDDEFLWQGALILLHSAEMLSADQDGDCRDGVWLGINALKRHLWVEPTRLFRPYDRALSAIRVTALNVPSSNDSSAPASVTTDTANSSADASAGPSGTNTGPGAAVNAVPQVAQGASESDVQQLRAEFSTLVAEMTSLKQLNAESLARAKKVEGRLERHRERKREKRERRRSGAVDSVISAFAVTGSGDPHAGHHQPGHSARSYAYGQNGEIARMSVANGKQDQEVEQVQEDDEKEEEREEGEQRDDRELVSEDDDGDTV